MKADDGLGCRKIWGRTLLRIKFWEFFFTVIRGGDCNSMLVRIFSSTLLTFREMGFASGLCRSFFISTLSPDRIFITTTQVQLWNLCLHVSPISLPNHESIPSVAILLRYPKFFSRLINKVFFSRCFFLEGFGVDLHGSMICLENIVRVICQFRMSCLP